MNRRRKNIRPTPMSTVNNAKLAAVITSGFSESERVHEARNLGAGVYVKKPYRLETMARAVRDELRR